MKDLLKDYIPAARLVALGCDEPTIVDNGVRYMEMSKAAEWLENARGMLVNVLLKRQTGQYLPEVYDWRTSRVAITELPLCDTYEAARRAAITEAVEQLMEQDNYK